MEWKVKGKNYYFGRDFRELPARQRIRVVKMVRNLLKIQKEDKSFIADPPPISEGEKLV